MRRGVTAFPSPFGNDCDLMFAGNGGAAAAPARGWPENDVDARARAKLALPARPARSCEKRRKTAFQDQTPGLLIHHAPFCLDPAERGQQTVKLGRRGFHLRSRPAGDAGMGDEVRSQSDGILVPTAIVGIILASAGYLFNFLG